MPRYLVERTFPEGLEVPPGVEGRSLLASVVVVNADRGVTWVHSFVTLDRRRTFCVYDAPSPEAIRRTAVSNGLPVDRITEIAVLEPYSYHTEET